MKDKKEHLTEILKATFSIPQVRDALWESIVPFMSEKIAIALDANGYLEDTIKLFEECQTPEELAKLLDELISVFSNVEKP